MTQQFRIEQDLSPNRWEGRKGHKIRAIVIHITAGAFPGCLNWMKNPVSKASANYLVTRTGRIIQLVRDEDSAWANGGVKKPNWRLLIPRVNPNRYTISIEHEGYGANGGDGTLTEPQYQATLWLHRQLIKKYDLPVDQDHIIGHYRIDSVNRPNCPGPKFPWDRLFADLKGVAAVAGDLRVAEDLRKVKIRIEGKEQKVVEGVIINNTTYAPVRAVAETLGRQVDWDNATREVVIK